jgi:tRNA1(Val) A37 N6-methylase TrmN6
MISNITLDLQHHLYSLTLDGRLFLSPLKHNVRHVLDIGTGTGIWAIEFGLCSSSLHRIAECLTVFS